jgi:hypothetical protein
MLIENASNEIKITISSSVDKFGLQRLINYAKYLDSTSKSKAKQSDIDRLADEVNNEWWENNKSRFTKQIGVIIKKSV